MESVIEERYGKVTVHYFEEDGVELQKARPEDVRIGELLEEGYDCRKGTISFWPVLYHLSHLRENLTEWLPIQKEDTVLEFGADSGQLTGGFLKKAERVFCMEESIARCRMLAKRHREAENLTVYAGDPWKNLRRLSEGENREPVRQYDWIIAPNLFYLATLSFSGAHREAEALALLKSYLRPGGHLVIAADNRFGLKYWAGAMEPHTGRYFDSLEGEKGTYSKRELEKILQESNCQDVVFYYPYPEWWFPMALYSDEWLPKAGELNRNLRNFEGERLVLFEEEKVYDKLIADGRFSEFSNAYLCVIGPKTKEQTVFVKYSNDRAKEFALRTDIVKKITDYKVRKIPIGEEARAHVQRMKHWEEVLTPLCWRHQIGVNRCVLEGDGACFEYLKGSTLEERLDTLRRQKDYAGLTSEILRFQRLLTETLASEAIPFVKSETFVQMFGNPEFTKAYKGAPCNNLDWIFGNLMETEDGLWMIDYEWTFEVQVPIEYLLWRALSLYLYGREDVSGLGIMTQVGISKEEERIFEEMEHHFQLWLLQGTVTIGAQYLATAGRTITLEDMLKTAKKERVQVYLERGEGFSEADSFWMDAEPDKKGIIHMELALPAGTKGLRIDPAETTCLVKIKRLLGELNGSYPLEYLHNGRELEEEGILYTTSDPNITVTNLVCGTARVYLEMTVQELYPDTAYACMNLLNRVRAAERLYQTGAFRMLKKIKRLLKK